MAFPDNLAELEQLAKVMRREGILQAFGVVLGPQPTVLEKLQLDDTTPGEILRAEERLDRIRAAREEKRDLLAGTGRDFSDEEIDRIIDPKLFEEVA